MSIESRIRGIKDSYQDYADMVYCIALFYVKNSSLAEEMMQDVFVSLIRKNNDNKKTSGFELRENQKAWLIELTVNQCKEYTHTDWFRENTKRVDYSTSIFNGYQSDREDVFYHQLFTLPSNLAVVFYLYYVHGYTHSELAELLNQRVGVVTIRLKRARRLMKSLPFELDKMPEWEAFRTKLKKIRCPLDRQEVMWGHLQEEIVKQENNHQICSYVETKKNPITTYIEKMILQKKPLYIAGAVIVTLVLMIALLPHIVQCTKSVKTRDLVGATPTTIVKSSNSNESISLLEQDTNAIDEKTDTFSLEQFKGDKKPIVTRVDPNGIVIEASTFGLLQTFMLPSDSYPNVQVGEELEYIIEPVDVNGDELDPMANAEYAYMVIFNNNKYSIATIDKTGAIYISSYYYWGDFVLDCSFNQPDPYGVVACSQIPTRMQPNSTIQFLDGNLYRIIEGGPYNYSAEELLQEYQSSQNNTSNGFETLLQPVKGLYLTYSEDGNIIVSGHESRGISEEDYRLKEHEIFRTTDFMTANGEDVIQYHEEVLGETPQIIMSQTPDSEGNYWCYLCYPGIQYATTINDQNKSMDWSKLFYLIVTDDRYTFPSGVHVGMSEAELRGYEFITIRYYKNEVALYGEVNDENSDRLNTFFLRENTNFITRFDFDTIYYASGAISHMELNTEQMGDGMNLSLGLIFLVKDGKVIAIATDHPTAN